MNRKETRVFIELVRAGLWEKEVRLLPFGDIDYSVILKLAEEQSIVGLVAAGLEHAKDVKVPQEWALQFAGQTLQLEQRNKAMNAFLGELFVDLREANIYAILVKGQGVAQCYDKPLWRASGDVDILLSDSNYEEAKAFLLPKGEMTEPEEARKKHFAMRIGQWEVELHGTLYSGLSSRLDRVLDMLQDEICYGVKFRSCMIGNAQVFLPDANEDVVYVFAHILQHFYKGGIGLRQICDWCRLLYTYKDSLNYGLLESRIRRSGLMSEWKAFGALAIEYLGYPKDSMPLLNVNDNLNANLKRKGDRIMEFILEVGNFGHNRANSYFQKHSYFVQKCISAWRRVKDLCRHATIFPVNSVRFFFGIMYNGIVSAVRGE